MPCIGGFFSVLWYQPHTAELCHARYAVFLAKFLYPSFRYTPLLRCFGSRDIFKHCFHPFVTIIKIIIYGHPNKIKKQSVNKENYFS